MDPAAPTGATLALEQPASRADRVRDALRRAILDGTLAPGRPLVERELAELLGVSKTPVREALKQLHSSGLVEINAYQGVSVRRIDADTVRQLYTARAAVEPAAVRLASHQAGSFVAARAALVDAAVLVSSGETAGLGIANRRFHRELYLACGNPFLCGFLDQLQDLTAFVATAGWRLRATFVREAAEHEAMLDAAERGDAALAERLTREHIENALTTITAVLDEQDAR
ncbi:GntR family transcriptional regulator [Micromonospora endolithica]|uniref:GntR family transcriptional regulator n=1 Tax=Micromonospora endolithica TaxID=230091 RepID=UPI001EE05CFB|nr:GntR family transcriptional regulator [Micromonospora endolithica]